jgi:membrane-bound ClpP family serine protease
MAFAPLLRHGKAVVTLALVVLGVVLVLVTDVPPLTIVGALALGAVILRVGWFFLQQLATPPPPPPEPGLLRTVSLTYRCEVCGAEVRMVSAASEDPAPPRHCMEEMELIATADDAL